MEQISFDEFYRLFSVKRNPIQSVSSFENTLIEVGDEDYIEDEDVNSIWSLIENKGRFILQPGIMNIVNTIGYFTCSKKWKPKQESYLLNNF